MNVETKYVEMTLDEANKLYKNDQTVLVAVRNLEDNDEVSKFVRQSRKDCEQILTEAETIVGVFDEFINQLRAFTVKQPDIENIYPHGKLHTFLIQKT